MPSIARRIASLMMLAALLGSAPQARAGEVLLTFGEFMRIKAFPMESARRQLTAEEIVLYQNFEFYAYTVFEALQVANSAALLLDQDPLFCAPDTTFHFREDGDIARLAEQVAGELLMVTKESGGAIDDHDDKAASAALLLGLRAAFPCDSNGTQIAER